MKKTVPRQTIIKLLKTQDKQKSSQRKMTNYTQGNPGLLISYFEEQATFSLSERKEKPGNSEFYTQ